jgi:hypothetical protein
LRLADARLQHLVDLDPEACSIVGCGQQRAVLDSDYLQFLHRDKPFVPSSPPKDAMSERAQWGIARARRKLRR